VGRALGREQEAEAVVESVDREDERDAESPEDLDTHAEFRHPTITLVPVMFRVVWIARRARVTMRIVVWFVGSQFDPNQLWLSAAM
jgi:hypothetical protein